MSFHFPGDNVVVAGDTLFRGSIGRTDLWGGDFDAIERSIRERLYTLKDATIVVTGMDRRPRSGWRKRRISLFAPSRMLKNSLQLCSRLIEILNVPLRVRLRFRLTCGLAGRTF